MTKFFATGNFSVSLFLTRRGMFSMGGVAERETVRFFVSIWTGTSRSGANPWDFKKPMHKNAFCSPVPSSKERMAYRMSAKRLLWLVSEKAAVTGANKYNGSATGLRIHFSKKAMPSSDISGVWNFAWGTKFKSRL